MDQMKEYLAMLEREERSSSTRAQYKRSAARFLTYAGGRELTKELVIGYKEELTRFNKPQTVNGVLAALNGYFDFLGRGDLRVKLLKVQHTSYCAQDRELSREDYLALLEAARSHKDERVFLIFQAICGTGIRVSELRFITVEAVAKGTPG